MDAITAEPKLGRTSGAKDSAPETRKLSDDQNRLLNLADQMDSLAERCIRAWIEFAPDPRGGVYGFLDRQFHPIIDEKEPLGPSGEHRGDKSLIQISRHLYSYSLVARRRGKTDALSALSRSCFELLKNSFRTSPESPYRHQLNHLHEPRDERFQLYAQSFAIFGLSAYARAFADEEAAQMALQLFEAVDRERHDDELGGYQQTEDGQWLEHVDAPVGACKCTNTHIHVLEALTELSHVAPSSELVRERLLELARFLATRMTQPEGWVAKFFDRSWEPVGPREVSYGHDIETSWLLREAAHRLKELGIVEVDDVATDAANRMAVHALAAGWDRAGGLYDAGLPFSDFVSGMAPLEHVTNSEKVWWAQAEALPGIFSLYGVKGDSGLINKLEQTFQFLSSHSVDATYGEFYWGVDSGGALGPRGDHKGELWKTPYHAVRALVLTSDWIRRDVQDPR